MADEINNPLVLVSKNVAVFERDLRDLTVLIGLYYLATEADCHPGADLCDGISDSDRGAINRLREQPRETASRHQALRAWV
jgi:hypothetical protein